MQAISLMTGETFIVKYEREQYVYLTCLHKGMLHV